MITHEYLGVMALAIVGGLALSYILVFFNLNSKSANDLIEWNDKI
jgi:hypothetical protein